MYYLLLSIPVATILSSCGLIKNSSSQCEDEFIRQSVIEKTKSQMESLFKPDSIDVKMGKSSTVEVKNGEYKCQTDITIKATKINYKSKSAAELGK